MSGPVAAKDAGLSEDLTKRPFLRFFFLAVAAAATEAGEGVSEGTGGAEGTVGEDSVSLLLDTICPRDDSKSSSSAWLSSSYWILHRG
jgi:hypothetical protein